MKGSTGTRTPCLFKQAKERKHGPPGEVMDALEGRTGGGVAAKPVASLAGRKCPSHLWGCAHWFPARSEVPESR